MRPTLTYLFLPVFLLSMAWSASTFAQQQNALDIALRHLEANRETFSLTEADVTNHRLSDLYSTKHNGVTHVYLNQTHDGIRLDQGITVINILPDGKVLYVGNNFTPNLSGKANASTPRIEPGLAVQNVIAYFEERVEENIVLKEELNPHHFIFENAGIALEPIPVELVYTLVKDGSARLAWEVQLYALDAQNWWSARIDAHTGELLNHSNQVIHCNFGYHRGACQHDAAPAIPLQKDELQGMVEVLKPAVNTNLVPNSYNVFPIQVESPSHGSRELIVDPADLNASPFGWHDVDSVAGAEYTITRGNNVHAYHDIYNLNQSTNDEPDGGADLEFDFPMDLSSGLPYSYMDAAVTNLFFWNNIIHDVTYLHGFDEPAGNFQVNNYGNGAEAGDWVRAEAMDGSGLNNANMASSPDGNPARMQMYIWGEGATVLQSRDSLVVTDSAHVAGNYLMVQARFGGLIPDGGITSRVVLVEDMVADSTESPSDGCETILNAADIAGNIAMVDRGGGCSYGFKALRLEEAGAVAVILCEDREDRDPTATTGGESADSVSVPVVMLSKLTCDTLKTSFPGLDVILDRDYTVPTPGSGGVTSDLDNGVIVHEYTHGISRRLTGGPSTTSCLNNPEQSGEGLSDLWALMMVSSSANTPEQSRGIGTYVNEESPDSTGIRTYPYSTDMELNPHTYVNILDFININMNGDTSAAQHGVGSVWCAIAWEAYWALVGEYGFDDDLYYGTGGNNMAMRLFTDGLKMQPCNTSFVEMRNAILAADVATYGGANQCLLWEAFAKRGLGASARKFGQEAFDLPLSCQPTLFISKTTDGQTLRGGTVTYTLDIVNRDSVAMTNVVVDDPLPAELTFVDGSLSCANGEVNNGVLTINIGTLAVGETVSCSYQMTLPDMPFAIQEFEDGGEDGIDLWRSSAALGINKWDTVGNNAYTGEVAFFAENVASATSQFLTLREPIPLVGNNPGLTFWHSYDTEPYLDGGLVEISIDDGSTWLDVSEYFIANGYPEVHIQLGQISRITGRKAFHGNSNGYIQSIVDLSDFAGEEVRVRFQFATDAAGGGVGWYVDNIQLVQNLRPYFNTACVSSDENEGSCASVAAIAVDDIIESVNTPDEIALSIYPNPSNGKVFLNIASTTIQAVQLNVLDVNGRVLLSRALDNPTGDIELDLSAFATGVYMIQLQTAESTTIRKVVLQ